MSFDEHIDDIIMTMVGRPEELMESQSAAHEELRRTITLVLKGRVAEVKTNAVGSTREVATGLCRRLGVEGKVWGVGVALGVDHTAGGRRPMRNGKGG